MDDIFEDITWECIENYRETLKEEGKLVEYETPFGKFTIMKSSALDEDELIIDGKLATLANL